jgi:hypothetical protein
LLIRIISELIKATTSDTMQLPNINFNVVLFTLPKAAQALLHPADLCQLYDFGVMKI